MMILPIVIVMLLVMASMFLGIRENFTGSNQDDKTGFEGNVRTIRTLYKASPHELAR
ncbi:MULTISPECIES: hypothetical protein [unclassified Siphonobacter]|uniref:hypothetical protein n=1 Tax=unclassified Siphonobacter TaxID=2635712 RepID=UPI001304A1EF|nr:MULTISPECIES: hypothetical protein [unclassified Siphonobacter]